MKNHSELQQDIPAYVASSLEEPGRRRLELHLETCLECHELVAFCEELAAHVGRFEPSSAEHPDPVSLLRHARSPSRDEVAQHVEACSACTLVVGEWRSRSESTKSTAGHHQSTSYLRAWLAWRPLAVGALLGVSLALVGVALFLLKAPGQPGPAGPWGGQADSLMLSSPARGDGGAALRIAVDPNQPHVPAVVRIDEPLEDGDVLRFVTLDGSGATSWEYEVTAASVRDELARNWNLVLLIPTEVHPAGTYRFRATLRRDGNDLQLFERPFEVVSRNR